ncbi:helix-turn-helix domain-containing protein [Ktedonobacteria bacterium brp13]|nr:helix-turn-helix domain-containing protein [Ktedonobacteria bacterium brp13]
MDESLHYPLNGGKEAARSQMHARILLKTDQEAQGPAWTDQQIAQALSIGTATVERVRRRFVEGGFLDALVRRPQPERPNHPTPTVKNTLKGHMCAPSPVIFPLGPTNKFC